MSKHRKCFQSIDLKCSRTKIAMKPLRNSEETLHSCWSYLRKEESNIQGEDQR